MIDDRTSHLNLPLPHEENFLTEDVARMRLAFTNIDAKFLALDNLLSSDDTTLDQVQELVNAIKDNRTDVLDILISKAEQSSLDAVDARVSTLEARTQHEETQTLADGQTAVLMTTLSGLVGASVFIEGVRIKSSQWSVDGANPTRLILSQSYPAGHEITVVRQQGGL